MTPMTYESSQHRRCSNFFFQAEDGIRDKLVTGVQTCALPISARTKGAAAGLFARHTTALQPGAAVLVGWQPARADRGYRSVNRADADSMRRTAMQIGRASCRERE